MDSHADAHPVVVTADEKGVIGVVFVTTRGAVFAPPDEETNQTSRVHRPVAADRVGLGFRRSRREQGISFSSGVDSSVGKAESGLASVSPPTADRFALNAVPSWIG